MRLLLPGRVHMICPTCKQDMPRDTCQHCGAKREVWPDARRRDFSARYCSRRCQQAYHDRQNYLKSKEETT